MRGQYLLQTASTRELLCGEWERKDSTVSFRIYIETGSIISNSAMGTRLITIRNAYPLSCWKIKKGISMPIL